MADTKISALTALTGADVDTAADVLAIVDTGVTTTKKILIDELRIALGIATQAQQETGTSLVTTVTPGRQHFHASAAKAWGQFDSGGNVAGSYNVTSITDSGTGNWSVTIGTDFSGATYSVVAWGGHIGGATALIYYTSAIAAGSFSILTARNDSGAAGDPDTPNAVFFIVFGDQA